MRVVLDTNVVVSSLFRSESTISTLLDRAEARDFDLLISPAIQFEYLDVLKRPKIKALHSLEDEEIDSLVERLFSAALLVSPKRTILAVTSDPKDDKFIECAVAGRT